MPTACETFYDQDYLDLNPDVAKAGMNPREHWRNHGSKEKATDGTFHRKWNHKCTTPQKVAPIAFEAGSSNVIVTPTRTIAKVVVTFSDGTSQTVA